MAQISGNLNGLKTQQLRKLERLSHRRIPPRNILNQEIARALCDISFEVKRQVGLLVDRSGHIRHLIVGDARQLMLPDLKRHRAGSGRFRGLRLIHTHLQKDEELSQDDLTDLSILRLDLVAAICMDSQGLPAQSYMAHLLPENPQGEFWRLFPPQHPSKIEEDFVELISALENEFSQQSRSRPSQKHRNRAVLIAVYSRRSRENQLRFEELKKLAQTARITIVDTLVQIRPKRDASYALGKGRLNQLIIQALQKDVELLIFDHDLTTSQIRSLNRLTDLKIVDRTQLILDIFAQHARSRDGKLQVELAQLQYLKTRLSEKDDNMSRLTGGIGGRGPGETKLEIGKRRVQDRITALERLIRKIKNQRNLQRQQRQKNNLPVVSIVGYTNAGKSTLLNSLTNAEVLAQDALFATLDPTSRKLRFPEQREIILADTVGFIQDLPPALMQAFEATLEELHEADLLLQVVNIASEQIEQNINTVNSLLHQLGLHQIPKILVFNQIDQLEAELLQQKINSLERMALVNPDRSVFVSALKGENLRALINLIESMLWESTTEDRSNNTQNLIFSDEKQ